MSRTLKSPAPVWSDPPARGDTTLSLTLETITPMFGGGATTRDVDPHQPIRAASIRGHLRFWWRATAGAGCANAEELYKKETALWGDTEHPGKVAVRVEQVKPGERIRCGQFNTNRDGRLRQLPDFEPNYPAYALQPFQGKVERGAVVEDPAYCIPKVTFDLHIAVPSIAAREEVLRAVSAWVHFGGVGARTRRGCGSLTQKPPAIPASYGQSSAAMVTAVPRTYLVGTSTTDAVLAWQKAVDVYKDFRQKEGFARNQGQQHGRPGRSRWPEADSIRRIARRWAPGHEPMARPEIGFPRADLGLPIIFHFQGQRDGDPDDATLESAAEGRTRFASPVITKALALPDGMFAPMLAILDAPHVWENGDLSLNVGRQSGRVSKAEVAVVGRPMEGLGTDIRQALVEYAKRAGFREVQP